MVDYGNRVMKNQFNAECTFDIQKDSLEHFMSDLGYTICETQNSIFFESFDPKSSIRNMKRVSLKTAVRMHNEEFNWLTTNNLAFFKIRDGVYSSYIDIESLEIAKDSKIVREVFLQRQGGDMYTVKDWVKFTASYNVPARFREAKKLPKFHATLENWSFSVSALDKYVLFGNCYGDEKKRFPDGCFVRTSSIDSDQLNNAKPGAIIRTRNTLYRLGQPEKSDISS